MREFRVKVKSFTLTKLVSIEEDFYGDINNRHQKQMMKEFIRKQPEAVTFEEDEDGNTCMRLLPYQPPSEIEFKAAQAKIINKSQKQKESSVQFQNPFEEIKTIARQVKVNFY